MTDKRFIVTAECKDIRTGKRFFEGDEFLPAPDGRQAARLIAAGCIDEIDADSPAVPRDELDAATDAQLRKLAKAEHVDIAGTTDRAKWIELIRAARHAGADDLAGLDHAALLARAKSLSITVADDAGDDVLREAIRAKLAA